MVGRRVWVKQMNTARLETQRPHTMPIAFLCIKYNCTCLNFIQFIKAKVVSAFR